MSKEKKTGEEQLPDQQLKKKSLHGLDSSKHQFLSLFLQDELYLSMGKGDDLMTVLDTFMKKEFIPKKF
jgi:hypothetical protein